MNIFSLSCSLAHPCCPLPVESEFVCRLVNPGNNKVLQVKLSHGRPSSWLRLFIRVRICVCALGSLVSGVFYRNMVLERPDVNYTSLLLSVTFASCVFVCVCVPVTPRHIGFSQFTLPRRQSRRTWLREVMMTRILVDAEVEHA